MVHGQLHDGGGGGRLLHRHASWHGVKEEGRIRMQRSTLSSCFINSSRLSLPLYEQLVHLAMHTYLSSSRPMLSASLSATPAPLRSPQMIELLLYLLQVEEEVVQLLVRELDSEGLLLLLHTDGSTQHALSAPTGLSPGPLPPDARTSCSPTSGRVVVRSKSAITSLVWLRPDSPISSCRCQSLRLSTLGAPCQVDEQGEAQPLNKHVQILMYGTHQALLPQLADDVHRVGLPEQRSHLSHRHGTARQCESAVMESRLPRAASSSLGLWPDLCMPLVHLGLRECSLQGICSQPAIRRLPPPATTGTP